MQFDRYAYLSLEDYRKAGDELEIEMTFNFVARPVSFNSKFGDVTVSVPIHINVELKPTDDKILQAWQERGFDGMFDRMVEMSVQDAKAWHEDRGL